MKKLAALLLLSLAGASLANAASPDRQFYIKAAVGGLAEVESGKLAEQKASSEAVKSFASRMVQDHTAANEKLMGIAASKNIKLPTEPDAKHKVALKNLQTKSGAAFDAAYIKAQVADHKATIALMEREIASGRDPEAKAFASETLPVVKEHLTMLQNMKSHTMQSGTMSSSHSESGSGGNMNSSSGAPTNPNPGSAPGAGQSTAVPAR